ncbi:MAG TPA: hypothetical protein VF750_08440 [Sphingomicrobium sp.]
MIDQIFDRQYQAGRIALNQSILGLVRRFREASLNAFNVLNRIEYSAPWAAPVKRARFN